MVTSVKHSQMVYKKFTLTHVDIFPEPPSEFGQQSEKFWWLSKVGFSDHCVRNFSLLPRIQTTPSIHLVF